MSNNKTTYVGIIAIIGLVAVASIARVAMGQMYEDTTAEFMKANGQIVTMYEAHDGTKVTITSVSDGSGLVLYEDEMGEFLANAGYIMTEFSPEGGRNGELLIVAELDLVNTGVVF